MTLKGQELRVYNAMIKGEAISWKWGVSQYPFIADATRICRKLEAKGYPVKKNKIKSLKSSYMTYYIEEKKS